MGIYIHQSISKSITQEEWEKVYEETLLLMEAFPFAERGNMVYAGKKVPCVVHTREREAVSFQGDRILGWHTSMDYDTLGCAETYYIPRDLTGGRKADPEAWDAMMEAVPAYMDYDWGEEMLGHTYSLWDAKTQGEPYHMYLLAVACLIEDRLGEKAFIYGDITKGQCQKAVDMANQHLPNPIRVPARCEMGRLFRRVQALPLEADEKVGVFEKFYLGEQDEAFADFERVHFQAGHIKKHWEKRFGRCRMGTRGFLQDLKQYLSLGFGLEELCGIVSFEDPEGNPQYEVFLKAIMNSKLHLKDKNTTDYLDIQQDSAQPYSIWSVFAEFAFGAAHNPKVSRYIPIESIREALKKGIGSQYDVDAYIDQYLEKEAAAPKIDISQPNLPEKDLDEMLQADAAEVFTQVMEKQMQEMQEEHKQYAVSEYRDLIGYRKGSSVAPGMREALGKSFLFYHGTLQEGHYASLMEQAPVERCLFLAEQNERLLLRDRDWIRIFSEIEGNPDAFGRYYPMVRVRADSDGLYQIVLAFVLNDDLYQYAEELGKLYA